MHEPPAIAPQQPRALQPGQRAIGRLMREAEFGGQRFPAAVQLAAAIGQRRDGVQGVQQPVGGAREREALGPGTLGDQAAREVPGDAPRQRGIRGGRATQKAGGIDVHQAWPGRHAVAVVADFEQAGFGKALPRSGAVQQAAPAFGGDTNQLQRALLHHHEAERRIAGTEQRGPGGQAALARWRQELQEVTEHMIRIIQRLGVVR